MEKLKGAGQYLLMGSFTPFFIGLVSIIATVIFAIRLEYTFEDLTSRFIFSGIMVMVALVMMLVGWYLKNSYRNT